MKMINRQLRMGIKVESEHKGTINYIKNYVKKNKKFPTNQSIYKNIAKEHIKEDPKYYSKIKKYGL